MSKRRVANVMSQSQGFHQIRVQAKRRSDRASNLGHFQSVGETVAEVVGKARGENLRFGFQAAKRAGMHDAVAIARILAAVGVWRFRKTTAAGSSRLHRPRRACLMVVDSRNLPQR